MIDICEKKLLYGYWGGIEGYNFYHLTGNSESAERYVSKDYFSNCLLKNVGMTRLAMILTMIGEEKPYYEGRCETMPSYKNKSSMKEMYSRLEKLGYQMSDMEKALIDGTHPAYLGKEEK